MEVCSNFRVGTHASAFALFYADPNSMCFPNPQRGRNSERRGVSLVDQLCAGLVIEFRILINKRNGLCIVSFCIKNGRLIPKCLSWMPGFIIVYIATSSFLKLSVRVYLNTN